MERHGYDRPSRVSRLKTLRNSEIWVLKSTLWTMWRTRRTDRHRHDGPSWSTVSKHFNSWEFGTGNDSLNFVTEWQDGPSQAWRTVIDCLVEIDSQTLATSCRMDRRRLHNPSLGRISWYVLRDVFYYSCLNYKVSGLMLISLITWGLKEVTLS